MKPRRWTIKERMHDWRPHSLTESDLSRLSAARAELLKKMKPGDQVNLDDSGSVRKGRRETATIITCEAAR